MTSDRREEAREAFVWIWLPGAVEPVVAGRIARQGDLLVFNYGQSYLARPERMPIYLPELPLRAGAIVPEPPLEVAGCLRDGSPDAWGRRVIVNRLTGLAGDAAGAIELDELTFMLDSGSDRAGALDFQASPSVYVPRDQVGATLEDLLEAAARVDRGERIPPMLDRALFHGSSIGGARPKALIEQDTRKFIAKFSSTNDTYAVVKAEFVAMRLAHLAGLDVAPVELVAVGGKDVLLVERFDRASTPAGWTRRAMVSCVGR
jgi:serine/threonine-protein kinase HipA